MDDTKKTLLSIELDTDALIQNADKAKASVSALTQQLKDLKAAGLEATPMFATLSAELTRTTAIINVGTNALKSYTDGLSKKAQAQQDDLKINKKYNDDLTAIATGEAFKQSDLIEKTNLAFHDQVYSDNVRAAEQKKQFNKIVADNEKKDALKKLEEKKIFDKYLTDHNLNLKKELEKAEAVVVAEKKQKETRKTADEKKQLERGQALIKNNFKEEIDILDKRDKAYAESADKLAVVFAKNTAISKTAVAAKKAFAIAEIAISTEQQVASYITSTARAVENDMLIPFIGPVLAAVDIAGGAIQVANTIANGVKQTATLSAIPLEGKARGGIFQSEGLGAYLTGPGTGTSDSINARLSNGESVINARSTQMFGPILSAINQAGGGVPFTSINGGNGYAMGGMFNGSNTFNDGSTELAQTRAMNEMAKTLASNMPRQVLVVEDVQASLQNKVMLQNMSNF